MRKIQELEAGLLFQLRRDLDAVLTPEIRDEINQLRAERGEPPYGEPEPAKD